MTLEISVSEIKHKKYVEIKCIQVRMREIKLSLFSNYMILYAENLKGSICKLLELIIKFNKVSKYQQTIIK